MPMLVGSQSFVSIPRFMFVGAAVSEICKSNRNKEKNLQNGYSYNWPIFSPELPFDHIYTLKFLEV